MALDESKLTPPPKAPGKPVYGADGQNIATLSASVPAYAQLTLPGQSIYTWANPTTDTRGLQMPPPSTARIAATWYSGTNFSLNLNLADGNTHEVGIYMVDWDKYSAGRAQTVSVLGERLKQRRLPRASLADDIHVRPAIGLVNAEDPPVIPEIRAGEERDAIVGF